MRKLHLAKLRRRNDSLSNESSDDFLGLTTPSGDDEKTTCKKFLRMDTDFYDTAKFEDSFTSTSATARCLRGRLGRDTRRYVDTWTRRYILVGSPMNVYRDISRHTVFWNHMDQNVSMLFRNIMSWHVFCSTSFDWTVFHSNHLCISSVFISPLVIFSSHTG